MTKKCNLLDKGFLQVIDLMGDDQAIVDSARVSYAKGTKKTRNNAGLISFLLEHDHMTPFEMVELKVLVKAPIFVARQWFRHRIGSFNEESARYSKVENDYYMPTNWRGQSTTNKQCSNDDIINSPDIDYNYKEGCDTQFTSYEYAIEQGVSREQARMMLPLSTYTTFVWKVNGRSLMNFIKLRNDKHAQYEIRVYAEALNSVFKEWLPLTYDAFDNHVLNAVKFSRDEMNVLRLMLNKKSVIEYQDGSLVWEKPMQFSDTQWQRFLNKFKPTC